MGDAGLYRVIPLRIAGANCVMKAAHGQEDTVRDLHVIITDGCCVSRWEPTPDELAKLNAGGSVELWVLGRQPPVFLGVADHVGTE